MDKQPLVIEQRIHDMMQYGYIALRQFRSQRKRNVGGRDPGPAC